MHQHLSYSLQIKASTVRLLLIIGLCVQLTGITSVQAEQIQRQSEPAALSGNISGCPMFPENNIWNTPVDDLPVHARSGQWINSIGRNTGFHMDFGSGTWAGGPIGIPYNIVGASVPKVSVSFYYPDESDPGPYPIPANPKIEHGSDHHILIVENSTCTLYELYDASYSGGHWSAGSGAIWDLNSNALRPDTWTSADAAGLPILPGLVRYNEVLSGEIDHAIRFTASNTNGYIWPARHLTSNNPNTPYIPPMGARFRLKASFNVSGYPPAMRVILNAMKTYGIILADNGSDWYVSGAPDPRWDNDMLHLLDDLTGDDFEAVDTSVLMVNYNSGVAGFQIFGNTGVGGVKLSYTDGTAKNVTSRANGNYSLLVPPGWSGTVTPSKSGYVFLPARRTYTNITGDRTAQNYTATPLHSISGNAGVSGAVLSYIYNTPRTVISQTNGNYSLTVPGNWSGTVTPTHDCFTFDPLDRSYTGLGGHQTSQNYTPTIKSGCADVNALIGGVNRGRFGLPAGASTRASFSVDSGPVKVESTNAVPLISAERLIYKANNVPTSFSEMMALPDSQLDTVYWLPWYNNVTLNTQLRIANVSGSDATVDITIGGTLVPGSPFTIPQGASLRKSFTGIDAGPVKIHSDVDIVATERVIYTVNGGDASFTEMMALPASQLDTTYWLPWYNNKTLDTQLRLANPSETQQASVEVTIGGDPVPGSPFTLLPGASLRKNFSGIDSGPVQIVSDVNIVAAERVIYKAAGGVGVSFSEMMAFPNNQVDTTYWLPWYNSKTLDTQLRFANLSDTEADVRVTIGGVDRGTFALPAGASLRKSYTGIDSGPVKIETDGTIAVSERVLYNINGAPTSFSEMMAMPNGLLDTLYWLPWYNNKTLDTQLRLGVP